MVKATFFVCQLEELPLSKSKQSSHAKVSNPIRLATSTNLLSSGNAVAHPPMNENGK
jgi:hypothetical protein